MSQHNLNSLCVGRDVAKLSLQLHLAGRFHVLNNDAKGHAQRLKRRRLYPGAHLVCEATGGYEQPLVRVLHAAHIRVRSFARAQGQRAKTDPIDAAVLSEYGATFQPVATAPAAPQQQPLAGLAQRRRQLLQMLAMERNPAEHYTDACRRRQTRQLRKTLEKQIEQCDGASATLIAQATELAPKADRLKAIPGVGPVVAATRLAEMPELGKLTTQTAAALAGVAPDNRDSGGQNGIRRINGGRGAVRGALYRATVSAVRHDRLLKEFYLRLRAAGKKPLVARTAGMRKLIVLMNRLLKNNDFQLAN